ncbi:MAG: phosphoglycerate kinase [Bacteroidales bacterium]|nr:phosphoglycerate kinase [Bacteroidales bacterium]
MQTIDNYNFTGKKALIRVDFNVPLNDSYEITDDTRIRAVLPTINKIINSNGAVILMSHLGRPKEGHEEKFSLKHLVNHLGKLLNKKILFANDCIGEKTNNIKKNLKHGEVLLLENLRFYKEETKGDKKFAKKLSDFTDVYINDAFGTAHRAHASTTIVAEFFPENKMFGYLIEKELKNIDKVVYNSEKPFTTIIGGAKVSSKIDIILNLLNKVDNLIIGGGMTYTFIRQLGGNIGASLVEEDKLESAQEIMDKAKEKNVNLYLPVDNIIADKFDNNANKELCKIYDIKDGWMGLDIGSETIKNFSEIIENSKTILLNGPMGVFEMQEFETGTKKIIESIAFATSKGAFSLIGGGDSVAAINKYHLTDKVSYISTGGGALLEYIEGKELPGIKAIRG